MNTLPPVSCSLCGSHVPGAHGVGCPTFRDESTAEAFTPLQVVGFGTMRANMKKRVRLNPSEVRGRLDVVLFDVLSARADLRDAGKWMREGAEDSARLCHEDAVRRLDCAVQVLNYVLGLTDGAA